MAGFENTPILAFKFEALASNSKRLSPRRQPRSGYVLQPNVVALRGYIGKNGINALQPRSGCVLQPNVAAVRGYVGKRQSGEFYREAVASLSSGWLAVGILLTSEADDRNSANNGRNRFAVVGRCCRFTQCSSEARQRWAAGRNRFAVVGRGAALPNVAEARQRWATGRNRFAVVGRCCRFTQRSREARQRWAGGHNRFAVVGRCCRFSPCDCIPICVCTVVKT